MSEIERRTPLYAEHESLGARFVPYAGWRMPVQYRGVTEEHHAVRRAVGLFDVSHMGRLEVRGEGATPLIDRLITNDLSKLELGRALYTCCCNEAGGILDDLIVYRLAADRVLVICNAANRTKITAHVAAQLAEHGRGRAELVDVSDRTCLLAVQGPKALELVTALGSQLSLPDALSSFSIRETRVMGVPCSLARTGYTGEDGVEIVCAVEDVVPLWRGLVERGRSLGVEPVGLAARDTLRLEARLSLYGNEIDESTDPLEAGLGWTVKEAGRDFVGKTAIALARQRGAHRQLVGFEMVGRGIARHGYRIMTPAGEPLGVCTSGAPSPTLGKNIGLGYVLVGHGSLGAELSVDCRGRAIPARVVKTPFYRRPASPAKT